MATQMDQQIEGAQHTYESMRDELERRKDLLAWAYSKLHSRTFSNMDDSLKLDEIKILLEHGL